MLVDLPNLSEQRFGPIADLGAPDRLLFGANLLPLVMASANIWATLRLIEIQRAEVTQNIIISLLFLIVLYDANSGILLYWTTNNLLLLVRKPVHRRPLIFSAIKMNKYLASKNGLTIDLLLMIAFFTCFLIIRSLAEIAATDAHPTPQAMIRDSLFLIFAFLASTFLFAIIKLFAWKFVIITLSAGMVSFALILWQADLREIFAFLYTFIIRNHNWPIYSLALASLLVAPLITFQAINNNKNFYGNTYLFFCAAATTAALSFHWMNNPSFLFLATIPVYFLIGLIFSTAVGLITLPFARGNHSSINFEVLGGALLFSFIIQPTVHGILIWPHSFLEYAVTASLTYFIFNSLHSVGGKTLNVFLTFFILVNLAIISAKQIFFAAPEGLSALASSKQHNLNNPKDFAFQKFTSGSDIDKPNIYVIVMESMPDLKTVESLGFEAGTIRNLFKEAGIKVYPNTFTLGKDSLTSISKMVDITSEKKRQDEMRQIVAGGSLTNKWLQYLGYETAYIGKSYMTGIYNQYDIRLPAVNVDIGKLDFLFMILRGIGIREFKFDLEGFTQITPIGDRVSELEGLKAELFKRKKDNPLYMMFHGYVPGHSQNSGKCLPSDRSNFKNQYKKAIDFMKRDLTLIKKNDPESIVVFIGDHGPYLTGNCTTLNYTEPKNVQELHVRDRIGTLLAIHWPNLAKAAKYDAAIKINQDLFPVILSYLHDSEYPLTLRLKPEFEIGGRTFTPAGLLPFQSKD